MHWLDYRTDVFDGIRYSWRWIKRADGMHIVRDIKLKCEKDNAYLINGQCPICHKHFIFDKTDTEVEALILHKVENNLYDNNSQ